MKDKILNSLLNRISNLKAFKTDIYSKTSGASFKKL